MSVEQSKGTEVPRPSRKAVWLILGALLVLSGAAAAYWQATRPNGTSEIKTGTDPVNTGPVGAPWFRDVTATSGLHFTYRNGEEADHLTMLETLGGGAALLDFDGDGLLDIFLAGGGFFDGPEKQQIKGLPSKLYKNLGNFQFKDISESVGLTGVSWWYTHGAAVADYDRDGWPDLLVTGYERLALFHNVSDGKGGRRLTDVTKEMGLTDNQWSTSAGWGDINGDGYPDLYVCHYCDWSFANHPYCAGLVQGLKREVCSPLRFKPQMHALFQNDQGKGFRNIAAEQRFRVEGNGLGVVLADLNDDGRPDIFVGNDLTPNFLYFNRTPLTVREPGAARAAAICKLEEKGMLAGVALDEEGGRNGNMGVDAGDYDGSGRPSLWVTVYQNQQHVLARNLGREAFLHQSRIAGIAAIGQHFVAFGTGFVDADNDGWEDIVIANGHILRNPPGTNLRQRPILFHNTELQGRRFFKDHAAQAGPFFQIPALGRGLAIGDLDNDGWPDFVFCHTNSPVALLCNEASKDAKQPNRWLGIKLVGKQDRDLIGSTVIVEGTSRKLTRFVKGGGSYLSAHDPRLLFGVADSETVKSVTVKWSWGATQTWDNLEPGHYWELHEGPAAAKRLVVQKR